MKEIRRPRGLLHPGSHARSSCQVHLGRELDDPFPHDDHVVVGDGGAENDGIEGPEQVVPPPSDTKRDAVDRALASRILRAAVMAAPCVAVSIRRRRGQDRRRWDGRSGGLSCGGTELHRALLQRAAAAIT